jgi:hypothetical protein
MTHERHSAMRRYPKKFIYRWFGDVQMGAQARRMVKRSGSTFVS